MSIGITVCTKCRLTEKGGIFFHLFTQVRPLFMLIRFSHFRRSYLRYSNFTFFILTDHELMIKINYSLSSSKQLYLKRESLSLFDYLLKYNIKINRMDKKNSAKKELRDYAVLFHNQNIEKRLQGMMLFRIVNLDIYIYLVILNHQRK